MAVGSLGPWATFGPFTKGGTDGDGVLTLIAGVLVALALWRWSTTTNRKLLIAALVVAALATLVCIYDTIDVPGDGISIGWGLILALVASIALTVLCYMQLRQAAAGASLRADAASISEHATGPKQRDAQLRSRRTRSWLIWGGAAAAVVVLGVATGLLLGADDDPDEAGTAVDESPATETVTTTESRAGGTRVPNTTVAFRPYDIGTGEFAYYTELPSGAGWSQPSQEEPVPGELQRTTLRGPRELFVFIDRTPSEVPKIGGEFESRRTVYQPEFGVADEYVISQSESIPECMGSPCVDYLIEDGRGGGWGVLAGGTTDTALARQLGRRVMRSIR